MKCYKLFKIYEINDIVYRWFVCNP